MAMQSSVSMSSIATASCSESEGEGNSDELYGVEVNWDASLTEDIQPGEHILTIEVIPQPHKGLQHVVFFTDRNNRYAKTVQECKDGAKYRSIQAEDGYELCEIHWDNGTVTATQRPIEMLPGEIPGFQSRPSEMKYANKARESAISPNPKPLLDYSNMLGAIAEEEESVPEVEMPPGQNFSQLPGIESMDDISLNTFELVPESSKRMKKSLAEVDRCSTFWEPGVIISGQYEKRGGGTWSSSWRQRFFTLNQGRDIFYYEDDSCQVAKGELNLPNSLVIETPTDTCLNLKAEDRDWQFRFLSTADRDEWVQEIQNLLASDSWGFCVARGTVQKKGRKLGRWKSLYVKLYDNMVLKYFNNEHCSEMSGDTNISEVVKCTCKQGGDSEWPYAFDLEESTGRIRTYRVRTVTERIMFVSQISKYINLHNPVE